MGLLNLSSLYVHYSGSFMLCLVCGVRGGVVLLSLFYGYRLASQSPCAHLMVSDDRDGSNTVAGPCTQKTDSGNQAGIGHYKSSTVTHSQAPWSETPVVPPKSAHKSVEVRDNDIKISKCMTNVLSCRISSLQRHIDYMASLEVSTIEIYSNSILDNVVIPYKI